MKVLQSLKVSALSSVLGVAIWSFALPVQAAQDVESTQVQILSVQFDPRPVAKVEGGDFHFAPGQIGPVHIHHAPAIGYVAKGQILYQVEGRQPVLLSEGDAFYEPADQRILRFNNASATDEAIFIDYNFQQIGEPFIEFEQPLTENIDRRDLPTIDLAGQTISKVQVKANDIEVGGRLTQTGRGLLVAYVAEGTIELRKDGGDTQSYAAGESIPLALQQSEVTFVNLSDVVSAKVVTFNAQ